MASFSPKKASHTKRFCCVPQCHSLAMKNRDLSFHTFPKPGEKVRRENAFSVIEEVDRRQAWISVLRIGKAVSTTMVVCSRHFLKSDYILPGFGAHKKFLKKTAVPSQNLPVVSHLPAKKDNSKKRRQERLLNRSMMQMQTDLQIASKIASKTVTAVHEAISIKCDVSTLSGCPFAETRDLGTQVSSGDFKHSITDIITTEKKLHVFTGIKSFARFNAIVALFTELSPDSNRHAMNNRSKVFMFFIKLKLNWTFILLSILFGPTPTTIGKMFRSTSVTLASILRTFIYWPSKSEVLRNMPNCFSNYKKVRVVLDCTEIGIYKSKCVKCRIKSYSHYKDGQTIKYLIGVSPAGLITYLSPGYGGRASYKVIFVDSNLIDRLDTHVDDVMVDKGFLIKDICDQFGIGFICPPFMRNKKQFSKEEALLTSEIAKARVHVERAIERVKEYKIACDKIPWSLLDMADAMLIVCCAMANLSTPILGDDKFV